MIICRNRFLVNKAQNMVNMVRIIIIGIQQSPGMGTLISRCAVIKFAPRGSVVLPHIHVFLPELRNVILGEIYGVTDAESESGDSIRQSIASTIWSRVRIKAD